MKEKHVWFKQELRNGGLRIDDSDLEFLLLKRNEKEELLFWNLDRIYFIRRLLVENLKFSQLRGIFYWYFNVELWESKKERKRDFRVAKGGKKKRKSANSNMQIRETSWKHNLWLDLK